MLPAQLGVLSNAAVAAPLSAVQVSDKSVPAYPSLQVAAQVSVVVFPLQSPIVPFDGATGSAHVDAYEYTQRI